jgi:protoheme IX farnesyltransferase
LTTLVLLVNVATALVSLATWALYVCIYTPLKRRSVANTAVGAVAGAMPVLMGWTCQGKPFDLEAAALFVVVFLWQFPHFMAIAWIYRHDYDAAGLAVIAALALVPVSLIPAWHLIEPAYFAGALVLGIGQLACAAAFLFDRNDTTARRLLRASLVYLPVLLVLLLSVPLI